MKLEAADIPELRPVIAEIVRAVLDEIDADQAKLNGRLGYGESEAATLLGVERHVLRDCRLRGQIHARRIGKRVVYSRAALENFLQK
jgi:hypothetical protein